MILCGYVIVYLFIRVIIPHSISHDPITSFVLVVLTFVLSNLYILGGMFFFYASRVNKVVGFKPELFYFVVTYIVLILQ